MNRYSHIWFVAVVFPIGWTTIAHSQEGAKQPLRLVQKISLPNVKGRLDHMDVDVKGMRLFVAGLENGTLEVVDLRASKWIRSIPGFKKPQGALFVPELNKLFVASGDDGMLRVFRGDTFELLDSIHLEAGPNRVVYEPKSKLVYVGYGGKDAGKDYGKVGIIDAQHDKVVGDVKIVAHPSEILLDKDGTTLWETCQKASLHCFLGLVKWWSKRLFTQQPQVSDLSWPNCRNHPDVLVTLRRLWPGDFLPVDSALLRSDSLN